MEIKVQAPIQETRKWLHNSDYKPYAQALIKSVMNDNGIINDEGVKALRDVIDNHRDGGTTSKGFLVNTKYLLGAMKSISTELVDAIMVDTKPAEARSLNDF